MEEKTLKFKFSTKMARLLGRESVSSDVAALFELVKNSYDADAHTVDIYFKGIAKNNPDSIVIKDDGNGMTLNEIDRNWMTVGTYEKEVNKISKRGRRVVGSKGVGRFSVEKLGAKMIVISQPKDSSEEITLEVNWNDYDADDKTFNDIDNLVKINPNRTDKDVNGTTIIVSELRESWDMEKISKLSSNIGSLVIPDELKESSDDTFDVILHLEGFGLSEARKIDSPLLQKAPYKLTATIGNGSTHALVTIDKLGVKPIENVPIDLTEKAKKENVHWINFGPCKLNVYYYPGVSKWERDWNKYYKVTLKINKIKDHLDELNGIKIYRDGFWVRPYGEKDNDWLSLEKDRVQSNLKIGNTQVIGFVQISTDANSSIMDTTTREKISENKYFESLRFFVKKCIDELNNLRIEENKEYRKSKVKKEYENIIEVDAKYIIDLIEDLNVPNSEKKQLTSAVKKIPQLFTEFKEEKKEDFGEIERLTHTYRNLSSLGISSASSYHEIDNIIAVLTEIKKSLSISLKKRELDKKSFEQDLEEMCKYFTTIKQFLKFIRHFIKSLKEDYETDHIREALPVKQTLKKLFDPFRGILKNEDVRIEVKVYPDDLIIHINRANFYSIMINLLTNSIKALHSIDRDGKIIQVTVSKEAQDLQILFSNNGPRIDENDIENIFDMFVSRYDEGTGLGLTITREIVEEYDGRIEAKAETEFDTGATFEILIPWKRLER